MNELRINCPMRHPDNGNCTVAGGFCTAVSDPICEALHNAYDCGRRSIDPESLRRQGEWVKSEDDYCVLNIIKCSLCREEWCFEVDDDVETLNYHYCPNCGARMEGGNT